MVLLQGRMMVGSGSARCRWLTTVECGSACPTLFWIICAPVLQVFSVVEEMGQAKAYLRPCVGAGDGGAFGVVFLLEGVVGAPIFIST
jgi:hypothetical protein